MQIITGPYEFRDVGGDLSAWCPPIGAIGAIDLRSLALQADPGIGLFALPDAIPVPRDYTTIGASIDAQLAGRDIASIEAATGSKGLAQGTIASVLWQLLNGVADPTGQTTLKPLMPDHLGRMRASFAGRSIAGPKFDPADVQFAAAREQFREGYRAIRQECLDGKAPPDHYLKTLGYWGRKLGLARPQDSLVPTDLPKESPLAPTTTLNETFNKADAGTWGPDQTWSPVEGSTEVVSNRGRGTASIGLFCNRVTAVLSGADLYSSVEHYITAHDAGDYFGPSARHPNSSTNTQYWVRVFNTTTHQSYKYVAGGLTAIGTDSTAAQTSGFVVKLQCSGSDISRIYNGSTQNTVTDTSIDGVTVGGAYCGARGRRVGAGSNYEIDNWEAADLAGAGTTPKGWFGKAMYGPMRRAVA